MRCQHCGKENPETEAFCKSCGRELIQATSRNCISCGRTISWDANVCPYCGKDYRYQSLAPQPQQPLVSSGMKTLLYLISFFIPIVGFIIGAIYYTKPEDEYKHVGKMCIVLGIVSMVLTVGLSALLYVMVLGFGGVENSYTPGIMIVSRTSIDGGYKFVFSAPTAEVVWSDVIFQLSDGTGFASWYPSTQDLTSSTMATVTHSYGVGYGLGDIGIEMNATDLVGNGRMNNGDYITLTTTHGQFSSSTTYTLTLIWEPTGSAMMNYPFP